jgi:hypothetical protein
VCGSPMARQRCRRGRERSLPRRVGAVQRGACQGPGVGVELQSSFLVATRGGKGQSSSGGAPFPSAGHGAEQEAAPAAPALPRRPGDGHTPFNAQAAILPQLLLSQVSPFLLLCCRGGRNLGRKSPGGGGGQGQSKGRSGFYTSELGLGECSRRR